MNTFISIVIVVIIIIAAVPLLLMNIEMLEDNMYVECDIEHSTKKYDEDEDANNER